MKEKTETSDADNQLYKTKKNWKYRKENDNHEMENLMGRLHRRIEVKEETHSKLEDRATESK